MQVAGLTSSPMPDASCVESSSTTRFLIARHRVEFPAMNLTRLHGYYYPARIRL